MSQIPPALLSLIVTGIIFRFSEIVQVEIYRPASEETTFPLCAVPRPSLL